MGKTLQEVFVVEFPCGAFRVARTREGAKQIGDEMAKDRTCCEKGHDSWEVWRFVPDCRTALRFSGTLQLVASGGRKIRRKHTPFNPNACPICAPIRCEVARRKEQRGLR